MDKLRVKDIAPLKLPVARIAYLSACSTANSPGTELADEVTHIVSSFHIAGFSHVIGTLWQSEDEACNKIAVDFYSRLSETDNVAESYRYAIETEAFTTNVLGTIHSLWGIKCIETPYRFSVAEVLTLRQAYKGWEVGCVYSTLLESVMSGGDSVE